MARSLASGEKAIAKTTSEDSVTKPGVDFLCDWTEIINPKRMRRLASSKKPNLHFTVWETLID
jgi:hypothetical protein